MWIPFREPQLVKTKNKKYERKIWKEKKKKTEIKINKHLWFEKTSLTYLRLLLYKPIYGFLFIFSTGQQ